MPENKKKSFSRGISRFKRSESILGLKKLSKAQKWILKASRIFELWVKMRSKNEKNDVFLKNKKNEKTDFELYFIYAMLLLYNCSAP